MVNRFAPSNVRSGHCASNAQQLQVGGAGEVATSRLRRRLNDSPGNLLRTEKLLLLSFEDELTRGNGSRI